MNTTKPKTVKTVADKIDAVIDVSKNGGFGSFEQDGLVYNFNRSETGCVNVGCRFRLLGVPDSADERDQYWHNHTICGKSKKRRDDPMPPLPEIPELLEAVYRVTPCQEDVATPLPTQKDLL